MQVQMLVQITPDLHFIYLRNVGITPRTLFSNVRRQLPAFDASKTTFLDASQRNISNFLLATSPTTTCTIRHSPWFCLHAFKSSSDIIQTLASSSQRRTDLTWTWIN